MNKNQAPNRNPAPRLEPLPGRSAQRRDCCVPRGTVTHPPKDSLVPISSLRRSNEIDDVLRSVLNAPRNEVHAAIETVLKGWPGRWRAELWTRLRKLRNARGKRRVKPNGMGKTSRSLGRSTLKAEPEQAKPSRGFLRAARTGGHGRSGTKLPNWESPRGLEDPGRGRGRTKESCCGTREKSRWTRSPESWEGV